MIASHHGEYAFGSPVLPMTPEAVALHYIDNMDAKIHTFVRDLREDKNPTTAWTQYSQSLQRRLFKGGVTSAEAGNTSILESE
jgi:3'-5' exoribonuclease